MDAMGPTDCPVQKHQKICENIKQHHMAPFLSFYVPKSQHLHRDIRCRGRLTNTCRFATVLVTSIRRFPTVTD